LRSKVLLRCTLVAVALLVAAWLALSLRSTRLEADGREVVERAQRGPVTHAEVEQGLDDLRRARRFNADQDVRLAEVALLTEAGRADEAAVLAKRVVADEPDNLDAWVFLYLGAVLKGDDARRARALRAVENLNPQLAERLRRPARERRK
jgi:predicted Zn-dependent protease